MLDTAGPVLPCDHSNYDFEVLKIDSSTLHVTPHAYTECRNTHLFWYSHAAQSIEASCVRCGKCVCAAKMANGKYPEGAAEL